MGDTGEGSCFPHYFAPRARSLHCGADIFTGPKYFYHRPSQIIIAISREAAQVSATLLAPAAQYFKVQLWAQFVVTQLSNPPHSPKFLKYISSSLTLDRTFTRNKEAFWGPQIADCNNARKCLKETVFIIIAVWVSVEPGTGCGCLLNYVTTSSVFSLSPAACNLIKGEITWSGGRNGEMWHPHCLICLFQAHSVKYFIIHFRY